MNIKTFLIILLIVLLIACGSESKSMSDVKDMDSTPVGKDNQIAQSQVNNWREVYDLPYSISCMDERLGSSVVREFQMNKRGPTQEEINKVKTCDILKGEGQKDKDEGEGQKDKDEGEGQKDKDEGEGQKDKDEDDMSVIERIEDIRATHGGWVRTGNPKNDQFVLGYLPTVDEWRCGVAAVGAIILRNIKAGKHLITDEENQKLQPCFRASPDSLIHPLTQVWEGHCIPLEIFLEFADYYRPSWEQLECHLKDLERYEMPNQIRYVMLSDPYGIRNSKNMLFSPLWDRVMTDPFYKDLKLNFSPSMGNMSMPPSYDEEYNSMKCFGALRDQNGKLILDENGKLIVDEYWIHEALRGAAIAWIIEKKKGRRIYADTDMCTNAYTVQGNKDHYVLPPINSIQAFKDRALNLVIPQYVIRAKAAEAVKAEMMQLNGLAAEIEVVFSKELFLGNLSPSKQVELSQWYLDTLIPEVRKHFHGTIWIASFANYDDGDPDFPGAAKSLSSGSYWKNLSFAAADFVTFTMYAACDFRHTERYFNIQYDAIMQIVQRDNIRWGGLTAVEKKYFGPNFHKNCKDDFDDKLVEMEKLLISKLESLPIQPYHLNIPGPPRSWTKIDEGYSPTQADASKGDWQLFSLDVMETPVEIRELWMKYAKKHVIN